jgi:superfamily II DNA helicase RecQ
VERGVQIVYLTATLPPCAEPEFMNIMRIRANDIHMFRALTSCPNIMYSVVEYEEDKFGRGDIAAVYRLVDDKLEEYPAPAKIIVYSGSIAITQEVSGALGCHEYCRDIGNAAVKEEIRKAWESADRQVVVATNAFGLGINQPDFLGLGVRFVIQKSHKREVTDMKISLGVMLGVYTAGVSISLPSPNHPT